MSESLRIELISCVANYAAYFVEGEKNNKCVNDRLVNGTVKMKKVAKVEDFKYLGSTVQSNGECGREVKKRVQTECQE